MNKKMHRHLHVHHVKGNQLLGKFVCVVTFFTANKDKLSEEKSIAYDHFDVTYTNAHNLCILRPTAMS